MLVLTIAGYIVLFVGISLFAYAVIKKVQSDPGGVTLPGFELKIPAALIVALLGLIMVLGGNFGSAIISTLGSGDKTSHTEAPVATPSSNVTTPNTPSPTGPSSIKINPVNTPVPMCATFTGTGDVPSGRTLWLTVRTDTLKYYFKPVTLNVTEHNWTATNAIIGSQDDHAGALFTIYAVLVDGATNRLINQGHFNGGVADLPDAVVWVDQLQVSRSTDRTECKGASH